MRPDSAACPRSRAFRLHYLAWWRRPCCTTPFLPTFKMLALVLVVVPFWTSFLIRTYALKL
jgi:hypothetical protein